METTTAASATVTKTTAQLRAELAAAEKIERAQKIEYKGLVDECVTTLYPRLKELSEHLLEVRNSVYEEFETVLEMKQELFNYTAEQQSHTFTNSDGSISIIIGHRTTESYDDTIDAGISKVKEYLATLARDPESSVLVQVIMRLLSKDRRGNIKASRVVELDNLAQEVGDPILIEGISIIKQSFRPKRTRKFVAVQYRKENGEIASLPLSISQMDEIEEEKSSKDNGESDE